VSLSLTSAVPGAGVSKSQLGAGDRRLRWFELALVILATLGGSIFNAIAILKYGTGIVHPMPNFQWMARIVQELVGLALLGYVLWRRGRSFRDIGFRWSWRDLGTGVLVTIGSYAIYVAGATGLYLTHLELFGRYPTGPSVRQLFGPASMLALLFAVLNPFFEELIVRAYLMTEIIELTGSKALAVVASVIVQTSYHLYYGWWRAMGIGFLFLGFSLYYARWRRALPVVVAHMFNDVSAVLRLFHAG
jgi:membrane protease YdiL (CAAX protease family)